MRLLLLILVIASSPARADNKQAARDAYKEGARLYDLQDYKGALEAFRKAYVNFEEPTLLFNIAQCQRYLGQKAEAAVSYRNFLRKAPNSQMADEVRRLITQLEGAIEQEQKANSAPPSGTLSPKETKTPEPKAHEAKAPETKSPEVKPPDDKPPEVATPVEKRDDRPLIKKWWLWTAVGGGAVAIALGVGLGVGLSSRGDTPYPSTGAGMVFHF
jgi:hypothetical protein